MTPGRLRLLSGAHGLGLLAFHGDWEARTLSFLMITFQRMPSRSLKKAISGLQKIYHKGTKKWFIAANFPK